MKKINNNNKCDCCGKSKYITFPKLRPKIKKIIKKNILNKRNSS